VPTLHVNAELVPDTDGPHVVVFLDGSNHATFGPFDDWHQARAAALEVTDEIRKSATDIVREAWRSDRWASRPPKNK
jgi:hypothetical protein